MVPETILMQLISVTHALGPIIYDALLKEGRTREERREYCERQQGGEGENEEAKDEEGKDGEGGRWRNRKR